MVRTVLFAVYFWLLLIISPIFSIPYLLLRLLFLKKAASAYVGRFLWLWSRNLFWVGGMELVIRGAEKLPKDRRDLCIIANHQSLVDIAIIKAVVPWNIGFIAKKELGRVPFLNLWIWASGCVLINRRNPKSAIKAIEKGVERIKKGHSMIIFPEGTRSRSNGMRPFKRGSFKLPLRAEALLLPITIDGSFRVIEEHNRVTPCRVVCTVHDPIETKGLSKEEILELPEKTWQIVNSAMENPESYSGSAEQTSSGGTSPADTEKGE